MLWPLTLLTIVSYVSHSQTFDMTNPTCLLIFGWAPLQCPSCFLEKLGTVWVTYLQEHAWPGYISHSTSPQNNTTLKLTIHSHIHFSFLPSNKGRRRRLWVAFTGSRNCLGFISFDTHSPLYSLWVSLCLKLIYHFISFLSCTYICYVMLINLTLVFLLLHAYTYIFMHIRPHASVI